MFTHIRKAAVALVAAGTLMLGGASAAVAVPESIVDSSKAPGTIHLTKLDDGAGAGVQATGTKLEENPKGATPIKGIEFTLTQVTQYTKGGEKVNIDMTSNDQIADLGKLDAAVVKADKNAKKTYSFGEDKVQTTDVHGYIKWGELPLGVYLLEETNSTVDGKTYKAAAPSLIFLPTTHPKQDKWITDDAGKYAVYVYPKNSLDENTKTVDDTNKQVGDQITYTISATIPAVKKLTEAQKTGNFENLNYDLYDFAIWDNLDEKLAFSEGDEKNTVKVTYGTEGALKELKAGVDYKLHVTAEGGKDTGQKIHVVLTDAGLNNVAAAKHEDATAKVYMTFTPTVKASGIAPNQAIVIKNAGDFKGKTRINPDKPEDPKPGEGSKTNVVVSAWGKLVINKKDGDNKPLTGAEFKIYGVKDGVVNYNKAISVNGTDTFKPEGEGATVVVDGLHANNLVDSKVMPKDGDEQYDSYVLVETKAPEGFELNHKEIPFTIKASKTEKIITTESWKTDEQGNVIPGSGDLSVDVEKKATGVDDAGTVTLHRTVDVVNIKSKPKLPMTGGAGVALFGILGLAIIGGGVYAAKRNTKKA